MTTYGFTGTARTLSARDVDRVSKALFALVASEDIVGIVTGACVGIDSYVHHWFFKNYPWIHRTVVFPGDLKAVDLTVEATADEVIRMPKGSSYRARNEKMVEISDRMAAFWTGQQRSGTHMTLNIAKRADKILRDHIFGMGLSDEEVRTRFFGDPR